MEIFFYEMEPHKIYITYIAVFFFFFLFFLFFFFVSLNIEE